jgi:hypothetical protein
MVTCNNCSNEYDNSLKICPKCGARAGADTAAAPQAHSDDAQVEKMRKGNRRLLMIMSGIFALFILSGFFVQGQGIYYKAGAALFFPVFVLPMLFMKKWAAYATLVTLIVLVFAAMLSLIGGAYSTALGTAFGIASAVFFFLYIIVIFENMDAMN